MDSRDDTTLGSASQSAATAIEQNDSSSSPWIDKADTQMPFYSTRDEGQKIGETTTFTPALILVPLSSTVTTTEHNDSPSSPQIDDPDMSFYSTSDEGQFGETTTTATTPALTPAPFSSAYSAATATEQNDGSLSPKIDKANKDLSFHTTHNEGQIGETATFSPSLTLAPLSSTATTTDQNDSSSSPQIDKADTDLSFYSSRDESQTGTPGPSTSLSQSSTLIGGGSTDQTYGAQVSVNELSENRAQLAYPPPVRRRSQSQSNDQAQSATTSPPVAQNFIAPTFASSAAPQGYRSPYSQDSYRVPTAQTPQTQLSRTFGNTPALSPRTFGERWNSDPSSFTLQQHTAPLQRSAPTTPSMYSGMPPQLYGPSQTGITPQPHPSGPTQPLVPPSVPPRSYVFPNVPTPQASRSIYEGTHQQFGPYSAPAELYRHLPGVPTSQDQPIYAGVSPPVISQMSGSPFGQVVPFRKPFSASPYSSQPTAHSRRNSIAQTASPQRSRKANGFVASDPFRVTHRNEKVDATSDVQTFDDVPTAGPPSGPTPARPSRSDSLPIMPIQSKYAGTPQFTPHSLPNMSTPQAQSIHMGTPQQFTPQSYGLPQAQSVYVGTPQQFTPQSYGLSTPAQSIHAGTPQQFTPQSYGLPPQAQSVHVGTPQQYGLPNVHTPQAQSIHAGTPQQFIPPSIPSRPQTSQSIYAGTPQQSIPQSTPSQFYSSPNVATPQAQSIHTGTPQPSRMSGSFPGASYVPPTPSNPTSQAIKPQRTGSFVANDPFQMSSGAKADAPSNFDEISTAGSSPVPKFTQGPVAYGAPPSQPTFGGYYPGTTPPTGAYGQSPFSGAYPPFYGSPLWYQPEIRHSRSRPRFTYANVPLPEAVQIPITQSSWSPILTPPSPFIPPLPEDDASLYRQTEDTSTESSIHHSPIIVPNVDDTTPPAVPVNRRPSPLSSSTSSSEDTFYPHGPWMGASQSPYRPYQSPYRPYQSPYRPYQYPNLPKKKESIFSRLGRLFRGSNRAHRIYPLPNPQPFTAIYPQPFTQPFTVIYPPMDPDIDWHEAAVKFLLEAFPKQMYLIFLLRLPSLYFSRVSRIFEEADMSLPEIKKMALETASQGLTHEYEIQTALESSSVPPAYKRLTSTWEFFIDSVMREWKTFNIISVLLLSAILTILQIQSAADDPLTRYTALFSLMCSLISLLFGCMYIIRFGSMRKSYKAAEWALEAQKTKTLIWWNVWVLLAMPAIWLTWSIILYIACIMSFIWRSGVSDTTSPPGLSDTGLLAIRIVMTVVLGIGLLYGVLILTTFQRYGRVMDKAWKQRIDKWIGEKATVNKDSLAQPGPDDLPPYPPPPQWSYPDRSGMYQPFIPPLPPQNQPSSGDFTGYPWYAPHTYVPAPHTGPPHSSTPHESDPSTFYRPEPNQPPVNTFPNNSSDFQDYGGMTSAPYIPDPGAFPPPNPRGPVATAEGYQFPSGFVSQGFLSPVPESPITPREDRDDALAFSSGLSVDDAPQDGHRVRFRLPSGSSGSPNQGFPREPYPRKPPPKKTAMKKV